MPPRLICSGVPRPPLFAPYATVPPFPTPVRKVGAPLAALIALGTLAGLILSLLTATDPGGAALGLALSTVAMAGVLLCYLWLDRWEPEPPRLLVMAFLWGASAAVLISVLLEQVIDQTFGGGPEKASFVTVAIGAPVVEEAAKGLFLLLMMTGRRRIELNTLTDCLVYAGFTAAGFAWLENIFYIASAETLPESLVTAGTAAGDRAVRPSVVHHNDRDRGVLRAASAHCRWPRRGLCCWVTSPRW